MSIRIMNGLEDLTGRQFGTITAVRMVKRWPEPTYATVCDCGSESTATHTKLRNGAAVCRNATCGKPIQRRATLAEENRKAIERENARLADEREASDRRMSFETEDYERPTRYTPKPSSHEPMTERERIALRERREAEEVEERERLRPIREAEQRAAEEKAKREDAEKRRKDNQRAYWRELVETGPDPQLFVPSELATAKMSMAKADEFNFSEVQKFVANTPEYSEYKTPENSKAITEYLVRNGVRIADAATFKAAFIRLRELGILAKREAPKPLPTPVEASVTPSRPTPSQPTKPQTFIGRDYQTGGDREFTAREVDRMSSLEFKRAFPTTNTIFEMLHN